MKKKVDNELIGNYKFTIMFGIVLIIGIIANMIFNNDIYNFHLILSTILKIIPIILTCMIVDDLYRIKTKSYRKVKCLIESFLLVLISLVSISYDFSLNSSIYFLIIISYNYLTLVYVFTKR